MGINSASYLIMPKIAASLVCFPILVVIAAFLQMGGGLVAGDLSGEIAADDFLAGAREYFLPFYVNFMLLKALCFGFIISSISAYQGFHTYGGALEVGQSSTRAVVYSCIVLLLTDYVLAQIML